MKVRPWSRKLPNPLFPPPSFFQKMPRTVKSYPQYVLLYLWDGEYVRDLMINGARIVTIVPGCRSRIGDGSEAMRKTRCYTSGWSIEEEHGPKRIVECRSTHAAAGLHLRLATLS